MITLLSKKQAAAMVGLHPDYIVKLAAAGRFPKPIRLGETRSSSVRFLAEEIEAWIEERIAARDGEAGAA